MKFSSIETANSAEQHHYKNRKVRDHKSTHWRLRLVSQDYMNVLTKTYGYGPLSPPGINHFLPVIRSHHVYSPRYYSNLPGWLHISSLVDLQEVYPEFRHPYVRRLYHESVSGPPIPPTTENAKSTSPNLSNEPRQLDPALHESDSDPLMPIMMDLSEDFRLEFSPAQINGRSDTTDAGFNQLLPENGNHPQLNNFEPDLSDVALGTFSLPGDLGPEPAALPAAFDVKGEEDLFNAFFNMDE
ncbi:hypothetical protein M407DRAFT_150316 [Tulasnella calospora MUT 4182]|uniref:Uncharacterized protein n=1 Tax=Tulasnella calospora MUT 4182 TaxID=1051891 RepID=A0A0C3Q609_9AGAM|nr:hypothetical protein M407DRAFT_150316 [Tulasnella calospora MUT 4182]